MKWNTVKFDKREWFFQALFILMLFVLYTFDKESPTIELYQVVFFLHYAILALFVSYVLLPRFFYTKKYAWFAGSLLLVFAVSYLLEEFVLERLFLKGPRAKHVANVFFTLLEIVPLILTMVSFKLAWDTIKKQREVEQLQLSVQESELKYLKSQINPHFLFNNLNNLYSYAIENSPKTPDIILELSAVLRYMLYDCKEDFVPLAKEIEHLKHFTALNELQIENRGSVQFQTSAVPTDFVISPLILLMFIENAFKHSTSSQSKDIFIAIFIEVSNSGELQFQCKNSFLPSSNKQSLSQGIGLENVRKRLQLIYPNQHQLNISTKNNIYDVSLILQLDKRKTK